MNYTDNFEEVFYNGYTDTNRTLLEADAINSLNNQLNDGMSSLGLPECHLNFGNLGNLNFSWLNFSGSGVNFKLFNKLARLSYVIRNINDAIIDMIVNMRCCGLADMYNRYVLPIFEWLLKDFINVLIGIAEGIMIGYQSFKTIMCIIRPVPGNPWMQQGGYDWLNMIYSYINGFEAIYNWLMDGSALDIILNPITDFYDKITSCAPTPEDVQFAGTDTGLLSNDRLDQLLKEYTRSLKTDEDIARLGAAHSALIYAHDDVIEQRNEILRKIAILQNKVDVYVREGESPNAVIALKAEIAQLNDSFITITANEYDVRDHNLSDEALKVYNANFRNDTLIDINNQYMAMVEFTNRQTAREISERAVGNPFMAQNVINQMIVDQYDPACSCLTTLLGIDMYKPPSFVTVSTKDDVDVKLGGQVCWADKEIWQENMQRLEDGESIDPQIKNIYITNENISEKYRNNNTSVDRDNKITAGIFIDGVGASDYFSTTLHYQYYNYNGALESDDFDLATNALFREVNRLYIDSGHSSQALAHQANNISTVFKINADRLNEIEYLIQGTGINKQKQIQIEHDLETVWNELRRRAIAKMKYSALLKEINGDNSWWDTDVMNKDVYEAGYNGALNFMEGQTELARLGPSFNIIDFLNNIDDTFANNLSATNPGVINVSHKMFDIKSLKQNWTLISKELGLIDGAIDRLRNLIKLDNVVVQIVDSGIVACSCDIVCKLLQWILDIILNTVKQLIGSIIDRILKATMNEYVSYIIRFIVDKASCLLDIMNFENNIQTIRDEADALIEFNNRNLEELDEFGFCFDYDSDGPLGTQMDEDEIPYSEGEPNDFDLNDTIRNPDPVWGVPSDYNSKGLGNILVNFGGTAGQAINGRNMPEIVLDCMLDTKPFLELAIQQRETFEIMVAFKPSELVANVPIKRTPQENTINDQIIRDGDGNEIVVNESIKPIESMTEIMEKVNQQMADALDYPIYLDSDCEETLKNPNNLTLCSEDNLWIHDFILLNVDDHEADDFERYGKLDNEVHYITNDEIVLEYFPESENADENGMAPIESGQKYWVYEIPSPNIIVEDPIVFENTVQMPDGTDTTTTYSTSTDIQFVNFIKHSTLISVEKTYETTDGVIYETTTITRTKTIFNNFRYSDLSFLVDFRNKVNRLKVRMILDIINVEGHEVSQPYNISFYNGRYTKVAELGYMETSNHGVYNISTERLLFLSKKLLKENYMITDARAVSDKVKTMIENPVDNCLLPDETKHQVETHQAIVDNISTAVDDMEDSLKHLFPVGEPPVITPPPVTQMPDLIECVPLMVLNKTESIMIQIVDSKLFLQFKSNSLLNNVPTIIDYPLVPDDIYMLIFNTNGLVFSLSLITPDKEILIERGLNTSGFKFSPSIIGGNAEHTETFCGTIYDVIITERGTNTTDFYNRSLMGYIPRTSKVVFDFSVFNGSRAYNTLNRSGTTFIHNNDPISNKFMDPIPAVGQKADIHGEVLSNSFYQVFKGYMDNFFCKNNLTDIDFTISFWMYSLNGLSNRQILLSDDINQNYIFYNAIEHKIIVTFKNAPLKYIYFTMLDDGGENNDWIHITLKHKRYLNQYTLIAHKLSGERREIVIDDPVQFNLMSIFAEYNYDSRIYENKFDGYLAAVVVYFEDIVDNEYDILHREQSFLVRGMQNVDS